MKILVTGATGLIGSYLIPKLKEYGHSVIILTRFNDVSCSESVEKYSWQQLEEHPEIVLNNVEVIIHMAGASIAKGRWTKSRKNIIINSRIQTAQALFDACASANVKLNLFISVSAVGFYPYDKNKLFNETDNCGTGFLSNVCQLWETTASNFSSNGVRTVIVRLGSVLASKGGMLKPLVKLTKLGMGVSVGNGNQFLPWISVHDVVGFILFTLSTYSIDGVYNLVAPEIVTNKYFMETLNRALKKKSFFPPIPSLILKLFYGQKSELLLKGSKISSQKLTQSGYQFSFSKLEKALNAMKLL
jgi:hypothetical protein